MSAWTRIDAWLRTHAPTILDELRPPASSEAIARLEAHVGRKLPPGLVAMYEAHDGVKEDECSVLAAMRAPKDAQWARYMWWLPTMGAEAQLDMMRDIGDWPPELLPFAQDAGGNLLVVDLESGQVSAWDHETWETTKLSSDLDAWFTALADDMEARLVAPPTEDEGDEERLMLLAAPLPDVPPGELAIAEDRAARVFVAVLQEQKLVELREGADVEALVRALHAGLAIEDKDDRYDRVLEILEESPAIDEIFGDDDVIGALIEDLS
jgi:cell wall assembly regulator SMI1